MRLEDAVAAVAATTDDCVIITEAERLDAPGPAILWCNDALLRQTGYARDEVIGRAPRMFQGPATDRAALGRIREALRARRPVREDLLNYRRDGATFWTELSIRPLADAQGRLRFFVSVQRDVTARKQHEIGHLAALDALRRRAESEAEIGAQLAALGAHGPGGLFQTRVERDGRRRLTYWSGQLPRLFGLEPTQISYAAILAAVVPADRPGLMAALRAAQDAMVALDHAYRVRPGGVGERWLRSVAAPRLSPDGAILWDGHVIDVTEQRLALAELDAARRRAEAASEAKSRFLATLSHELRTPLNGILGMAALIESADLPPDQAARLRVIRQAGEALTAVLGDMLEFSRLDEAAAELEVAPFELAELARRIDSLHAARAREKGLAFSVALTAAPGARRAGDVARVAQIAHRLVDNAIKFTPEGGVAVRIEDAEALTIVVEDTGPGVPTEALARVFEPFAQVEDGPTRRFGGQGLGLTLARRVARAMGGDVEGASRAGAGAAFTVRLPLPRLARDDPRAASPLAGKRVLVAEDHGLSRTLMQALLAAEGLEGVIVDNGAQAVAAFDDRRFDAALLDIAMPVMDGAEALRRMRAIDARRGGRTPMIAVTARSLPAEVAALRAAGFDACVAKPVTRDRLAAALCEALAHAARGAAAR